MTISKDGLIANKTLALQLIGQQCASDAIGEDYEKDSLHFRPILPTTWKALADDYSVRLTTIWHFQLTPSGWLKTLEAIGKLCDEQMKKDLGTLSAALKRRLERTEGSALVGTDEIVSDAGLPRHWVVNPIHSDLTEHCLKRKGAGWAPDDEMESLIEVPIDFGRLL